MKIKSLALGLIGSIVLFPLLLSAQCDSVFFRNTASIINDVFLLDTSRLIGVGDNGFIIKSNNGGKSWRNIRNYNNATLKAIQMTSDNVGYIVGYGKSVLKTEDGGENWFPLAGSSIGNNYPFFNDLYFFNDQKGFIVSDDGVVVRTTDGGRSWKDTTLDYSDRLESITFVNENLGFICGFFGSVFRTQDGGTSWQRLTVSPITISDRLLKVRFIDATTGFIVGYGGLCLKTTDGGNTWNKIYVPGGDSYNDILFLDSQRGFICTGNVGGIILQTTDGGNTWNVNFNVTTYAYSYFSINTDASKKKVVFSGGVGRVLMSTTDFGVTFNNLSMNAYFKYNDLFFINDSTGYIGGENGYVYKTYDYGESWSALQPVPMYLSGNQLWHMQFLDSLHGIVSTDNIYKTTDGARSWTKLTTPENQNQIFPDQLHFFDMQTGLVVHGIKIFKTTDGGVTWNAVATSNTFFNNLTATNTGKCFAVGYGGELKISNDYGSTWSPFNLNSTKNLRSVYFYNNSIGFIGSADTIIYKTTDGGSSWTTINSHIPYTDKTSFHFVNDLIGYVVCSNGNGGNCAIYKTNDGGLTWQLVSGGSSPSRVIGYNILYYVDGTNIRRTDSLLRPQLPGYLYGPDSACLNTKSNFLTGYMGGVNYDWTLSDGGISSVNTINPTRDTVLWNATGLHTLKLTVSNSCGSSAPRTISTEVGLFKPVITVQDSILTATEGLSYQWFRNGIGIVDSLGGTARSIVARNDGSYTVQVKSPFGCTLMSPAVNYGGIPLTICPNGNTSISCNLNAAFYQWQWNTGAGFVNVSNNSFVSGATTNLLQLSNVPSSWYGYRFKCVTNVGTNSVYVLRIKDSWTGSVSTIWEDASNWSCGMIPDANTDVIISGGTVVVSANTTIRSLNASPGATIIVQPGVTLTITH